MQPKMEANDSQKWRRMARQPSTRALIPVVDARSEVKGHQSEGIHGRGNLLPKILKRQSQRVCVCVCVCVCARARVLYGMTMQMKGSRLLLNTSPALARHTSYN